MATKSPLLSITQKYFETDIVSASHALETMELSEAVTILSKLPSTLAAKAIEHLNDAYVAVLLERVPDEVFRKIANTLDAHKAASALLQFSDEKRRALLDTLDDKKKYAIQELLKFPEDSAGRIMSVSFIAFHGDIRVRDAVAKIKHLAKRGAALSYVYVVDGEGRLTGIMNMRDMLIAEGGKFLSEIMRSDIFTVNCFDNLKVVADNLSERRYFLAPVVDNENRLLGVIRADQLIDDVKQTVSEDLQKMFGVSGDEKTTSPIIQSLKIRLPWLHVNLATAFLAAAVVALFEDIIAKITVLAVYLPVVAGQGGNAGAQSLAIVMRGLVMREIPANKAKSIVFKEAKIGLINGIIIGIVTGAIAWFWQGNPYMGVVIGLGMIVNLTVAGFSGALIPIGMKALRLDPAQCSSIILTTITDVIGFFAFLGFAVLFQEQLL